MVHIVLVRYRIKPGKKRELFRYWDKSKRKPGLITERISRVVQDKTNTWNISRGKGEVYVNVGIWKHKKYWKKAFPNPPTKKEPWEVSLRQRVWLHKKREH